MARNEIGASSVSMWRRAIGLVLGIAGVSCAAPARRATPADPPRVAELPLSGFALIRRDAWLHSAPNADARLGRAFAPEDLARDPRIEAVVPVRILSTGTFVEVETVDAEEHCHDGSLRLDDVQVRFFVKREDLVPLLVRPVDLHYEHGTRLQLARGLAAPAVGDGRAVHAGAIRVNVWLTDDAIGMSYETAPRTDRRQRFAEDVPLGLDRSFEHVVSTERGPLSLGGREVWLDRETPVWDGASKANGVLVTLVDRCVRMVALARMDQVEARTPGRYGTIGDRPDGVTTEVRAGAIVSWPDGRIAGETRGRLVFPGRGIRSGEQHYCFPRALRAVDEEDLLRPEQWVQLCFDANDFTVDEPSRPAPIF